MTRYGRIPDLPDQRDHYYTLPGLAKPLPASVDLRGQCPPVRDQGQVGACTAFATTGMLSYDRNKQALSLFAYSELFLYFVTRYKEHTENTDSGASIRDAIKCALKLGVCSEDLWPYNEDHVTVRPSMACYQIALQHRAIQYQRVIQELTHMQSVLAGNNTLVVGISVYESFESAAVAATGVVPLPGKNEQLLGGHAVLLVGYDDARQVF